MSIKAKKRIRRHKKIRMTLHGTQDRPRLFVFRSNQHIYVQLVDDDKNKILMSASDKELSSKKEIKKLDVAKKVGELIAKKAKEAKIESIIFDRGGNVFHGRIKSLADGAREGGLKF